jgi:hypothetical protein
MGQDQVVLFFGVAAMLGNLAFLSIAAVMVVGFRRN